MPRHPVDAVEVEHHHFAPVPKDQLQTGETVEHPAEDEPEQLQAGVVMPTKSVGGQCRVDRIAESAVVGVAHCGRRRLRVQIQRRIERLCGLEYGPEVGVIKIAVPRSPVQHGAVETEFRYGSSEFGGGGLRIRGRQRREALQAIRVAAHSVGEPVIGDAL